MSKLLVNLALLNTKALVNAYTWSTLPLYAAVQRPWRRLKLSKTFDVTVTEKKINGTSRLIYSRPKEADFGRHPYYRYSTFPESFASLAASTKPAIGVREVLKETAAVDEASGQPVLVDGKPLMKVQLANEYRWLSAADVMTKVDCLARGLREMGIGKGDKVLIYAENGVQWFYTCLALARLNAVMVTLFSTLGDSGVVYGMNQSDARFVVTSESLLPKLNALSGQFKHLQSIVYIRSEKKKESSHKTEALVEQLKEKKYSVTPFDQVEAIGAKMAPCEFPLPSPDDIAVVMYTSGTTGDPKGVIIPHRQLNASIKNLLRMDEEFGSYAFGGQLSAAYLPQAHLFGYLLNLAVFCSDSKLAFSSPLTLLSSSPAHVKGQDGDMKLIQPQFFIAVPLVLERILKEIYRKLNAKSPLAAPLFDYAMQYKIRWSQRGFDTPIINRLICKKINEQFGGQLKLIGVSSAPLAESTHAIVQAALNVNVVNAYGATETAGGSHMLHVDDLAYGTCGVPYSSAKFYLKSWEEGGYFTEDKPNPRGEIVLGGDSIAQGYYKMEEETKRAFEVDEQGEIWYSSGDIGEIMPNGTLKIIDRKKDLQKLANGEFVSLGKIESGLRNSPFVENICVCTDPFSNHLTALVSPNRKAVEELAEQLQLQQASFEQICSAPEVVNQVRKSLKALCKQLGFKIREVPVQITLVTEEWSQDNNLLTAAFKLKRKQVTDFYAPQIRDMFAQANASGDTGPSVSCQLAKAVRGGKGPEDTPSITVS